MPKAAAGDTVTLHYTVKLPDGTVVETSREGDPLRFTLGKGQVLAGVDEAVAGMEPGVLDRPARLAIPVSRRWHRRSRLRRRCWCRSSRWGCRLRRSSA